ncbi:hypothetical protein [Rubellimicrobium sp. CFH 75288]|uniref:hypothetical protein n=1 Tax=Rubellimicrobium sp. CFH 75288 TaxID=2697034 RepID=UPI0014136CAB|nr:hypothetical protein [Rubellimicrobium sp. CFH 75288]NAZ36338.1 hypothetical protein [Rubellimicrobium sp. CFH 75288]
MDLFCGESAMVPALRARFPGRRLIGVDSSLRKMEAAWGYDEIWRYGDFRWSQERSNALIFCGNGIPDTERHNSLLPGLVELLAPGGLLAVQIPRQFAAPSHRLIREITFRLDPERFPDDQSDPVAPPAAYRRLLAPMAQVEVWETEYLHPLMPVAKGAPCAPSRRPPSCSPVSRG